MKQIIQNYKTGELKLMDVPFPVCKSNSILVKNEASLISIGTERSIIELGRKSLLGKAKARPDLVRRFIDKAKKEGILKTFSEAMGRLDNPTPLGYSSAGTVLEVGRGANFFSPGDQVACIGAGYASHAEAIVVPQMLCTKIPEGVEFDEASFGMLGIIAMHGIRSGKIQFGETVAVIGLGLLGLLSVQILKSYGCRVIATDIDPSKIELAKSFGADGVSTASAFKDDCERFTEGLGVDCTILTVASKSDEPVHTAVEVLRFGGRIVVVGVTDIHPNRNELWHKEVEIIVSRAGGPGTFDPFYENEGIDYGPGYVRWTENRNLQEFLRLVGSGSVRTKPLITHRFSISKAEDVYGNMLKGVGGPYIGVILEYDNIKLDFKKDRLLSFGDFRPSKNGKINIGVIGAGLFGKALLLPALSKIEGIELCVIATASGMNAQHVGNKYDFSECTTDYSNVISNKDVDAVVVLTPHSEHAQMVTNALQAGKHVFVEKPLCINKEELKDIIKVFNQGNSALIVGYNRRFSSLAAEMKKTFANRKEPMVLHYRVNAGFIPATHWVHSPRQGGSRVIGEICHFVDMVQYITGEFPVRVFAERIGGNNSTSVNNDNVIISIKLSSGSIASILYAGNGDKSFSRERVEAFCEGTTAVLEDYRSLLIQKNGKKRRVKLRNQDMGYQFELENFINIISGKSKIEFFPKEMFSSTLTVFEINKSLELGVPVSINHDELYL